MPNRNRIAAAALPQDNTRRPPRSDAGRTQQTASLRLTAASPPPPCLPARRSHNPHRYQINPHLPFVVPKAMTSRPVTILLLLITATGLAAGHWPNNRAESSASRPGTGRAWRRTSSGWEDARSWSTQVDRRPAASWRRVGRIHPLVVAALQFLLCAGVLVAAAPSHQLRADQPARRAHLAFGVPREPEPSPSTN